MTLSEYMAAVDEAYTSLSGQALEDRLLTLAKDAEAQFGPENPSFAAMLSEVGSYYRGQGRYEASEEYYLRALSIIPPDTADRGTALNNLAGTRRLMGRQDQAEQDFLSALALLERTVGHEHVLYASALNNLSLLYLDRKQTDMAKRYLAQASDILSQLPDHPDEYASSLCNLAALELRTGRPEAAAPLLEEAIRLFENELGTDTPHYHTVLNSLGVARWQLGDFPGSESAFRKGLDAAASLYGEGHPEYEKLRAHLQQARERMGSL